MVCDNIIKYVNLNLNKAHKLDVASIVPSTIANRDQRVADGGMVLRALRSFPGSPFGFSVALFVIQDRAASTQVAEWRPWLAFGLMAPVSREQEHISGMSDLKTTSTN